MGARAALRTAHCVGPRSAGGCGELLDEVSGLPGERLACLGGAEPVEGVGGAIDPLASHVGGSRHLAARPDGVAGVVHLVLVQRSSEQAGEQVGRRPASGDRAQDRQRVDALDEVVPAFMYPGMRPSIELAVQQDRAAAVAAGPIAARGIGMRLAKMLGGERPPVLLAVPEGGREGAPMPASTIIGTSISSIMILINSLAFNP